tara:strand:- start:7506 stop:7703 length:198 start_codon:yes stop_codon:yes gene_type:complete
MLRVYSDQSIGRYRTFLSQSASFLDQLGFPVWPRFILPIGKKTVMMIGVLLRCGIPSAFSRICAV